MANEFRVWQAAESVGWDCTIKDLAEETKLGRSTVAKIIRRKRWNSRIVPGDHESMTRFGVDVAMKAGERFV